MLPSYNELTFKCKINVTEKHMKIRSEIVIIVFLYLFCRLGVSVFFKSIDCIFISNNETDKVWNYPKFYLWLFMFPNSGKGPAWFQLIPSYYGFFLIDSAPLMHIWHMPLQHKGTAGVDMWLSLLDWLVSLPCASTISYQPSMSNLHMQK